MRKLALGALTVVLLLLVPSFDKTHNQFYGRGTWRWRLDRMSTTPRHNDIWLDFDRTEFRTVPYETDVVAV